EWAVSAELVPANTGTLTAPVTVLHRSCASASDNTGASPVVPATTRKSLPCSTSQRASVSAPSRLRRPSLSNGVTMAHPTAPHRPGAPISGPVLVRASVRAYWPTPSLPGFGATRALGELERFELLARVGHVLELDDSELCEALPQP